MRNPQPDANQLPCTKCGKYIYVYKPEKGSRDIRYGLHQGDDSEDCQGSCMPVPEDVIMKFRHLLSKELYV